MGDEQSWFSCRYAFGNLDKKLETLKNHPRYEEMLKLINEEKECDKLLREEGIHRFYYCMCPEMVSLGHYNREGIANAAGGYTPVVKLFVLPASEWYEAGADLFGQERWLLEVKIQEGLRMCTHCKFYEPSTY